MAPEQARGNSDTLGPAADQFAMAAIIYEMLAGRPAFDGELLSVVLYRIVHEPPAPLASLVPALPPAIEAAIARALAKEPEQRFPTVTAFWEALAAGAGAGATRVSGLAGNASQARPTWIGGRVRSLALSAGVVGAGLGLTWLLSRTDREVGQPSRRAPIAAQPQPTVARRLENQDLEPARSQALPILMDGKTTTLTEVVPVRPARKKIRRSRVSEAAAPTESTEPAPAAVQPASATESSSSVPAETPLAAPDPLPPPSTEAETPAVTKEPLVPHL
jgi:serine/threonine-protein kinase